MTASALLAACRFVHDTSLMALWGAFAYITTLVPPRLAEPVAHRLTTFRLAAVALVLIATFLALPFQVATIGDGLPDAVNARMLIDVVTSTTIGTAWLAQIATALALTAVQVFPHRLKPLATAATSAVALASLALGGHAVMQEGWQGVLHQLNDMLHVFAAGAWFGALPPLLIVLVKLDQTPFQEDASVALRRFSAAGHWVVAVAILSGLGNSFFIVGWPLGWTSAYRMLLTAKVVVVLAMLALAVRNRYWSVPRIGRNRAAAITAIRTGTLIEIALGLTAILLVSIFGMLDPDS